MRTGSSDLSEDSFHTTCVSYLGPRPSSAREDASPATPGAAPLRPPAAFGRVPPAGAVSVFEVAKLCARGATPSGMPCFWYRARIPSGGKSGLYRRAPLGTLRTLVAVATGILT